jgi:hypothetical protein
MTGADLVAPIDWSRPWLAPYRNRGLQVAGRVGQGMAVARALCAEAGADVPVRFVEAGALPPGEAYESFIARTASVPTRDNLHDLFNGLVWLSMPRLKSRLNVLHAAAISAQTQTSTRGPLRDALTLFDENAALLRAPPALADALRARDWHAVFVTQRALWRDVEPLLVGHALLEKLVQPRKAITAHGWLLPYDVDLLDAVTDDRLVQKPFVPLPVLGVPGWWPDNTEASFYDDAAVFRQAGRKPSIDRYRSPVS